MAILLPQSSGNIIPEYAATNITFNRQIQNINGILIALFTANISYERKDYLVNIAGEKIGIVSTDTQSMYPTPGMPIDNIRFGNIYLDADKVATLFSNAPDTGKVIGEVVADMADTLIKEDLILRGII
jgi:hypothetical protein